MNKLPLAVSTFALSAALFVAAPITTKAKEKVVIDLKPTTSWAATMIEGASPADSYCALTRQYDQGLAFTLGRNTRQEYSLAFDFQNEKLNTNRPYKINLQPSPGQLRAYEMMPASVQALVVRIGYDESFLQSLEKSQQLKAEIDGKNYQFSMDGITKGKEDLNNCVAGLTGESVTKTASKFSAEKIQDAEPLQEPIELRIGDSDDVKSSAPTKAVKIAKEEVTIPAPKKVATKKMTEEAKPPMVDEEGAMIAPEPVLVKAEKAKPAEVVKPKTPKKTIQISRIDSQESISVTPKFEPKIEAAEPVAKAAKIAESDIPKMEDKKLATNTRVSVDPDIKSSARPQSASVKDKSYGSQPAPQKMAEKKPPVQKMPQIESEVKTAAVEPAKAKPKTIVEANEPVSEIVMPAKQAREKQVALKTEEIKVQEVPATKAVEPKEKMASQKVAMTETRASESDVELEKTRKQLKELEKENLSLYQEVRKTRGQIDTAVVETGNEALRQIREYERKLEASRADNLALSKEIEDMRRIQEDAQVSALAGNPNGQQALKRYNEAKREIKRLGLLLEQQRLAHTKEKTELEEMLFDPAVAEQAQRSKLIDLEAKLAQAEKQLQIESQKINKMDPIVQKKLQDVEQKLTEARKKEERLKKEQITLSKKQQEIELKAQKAAEAEAKLATLAQKEKKIQMKAQQMAEAEAKLAEARRKEKELAAAAVALENKRRVVAEAEAKLAETRKREQQEKIRAEAQKIAAAEAKLVQARKKEQELAAAERALRAKEQAVKSAEAKLVQASRKEQELKATEQKMRMEARKIAEAEARVASASAKLAAANKKEQQIKAAEKRLAEQSKKVAAVAASQRAVSEPVAKIAPSARKMPARAPSKPAAPSFGQGNIQQLLNQSGLSSVSFVTQKSAGLYSWNAAGMTGKAQVAGGQNLSQFVQSYIAKEKNGCKGDFASLPASVPGGKQGFEIACVGPNGGKSASVVFTQKGSNLIAITHETTADNMDAAIEARDKVAARL